MRVGLRRWWMIGVAAFGLARGADAAVTLFYNSGPITATPGVPFTVLVRLTSTATADAVEGVSYQVSASVSGAFQFVSRTIPGTSPFQFSNAPATPSATMTPSNGTDLGAAENNTTDSVANGTFDVANITFMVMAGAPATTYTLSFTNASYAHPFPDNSSPAFGTLGTLQVSVPEPASLAAAAAGVGLMGLRRRR